MTRPTEHEAEALGSEHSHVDQSAWFGPHAGDANEPIPAGAGAEHSHFDRSSPRRSGAGSARATVGGGLCHSARDATAYALPVPSITLAFKRSDFISTSKKKARSITALHGQTL